MEALRHHPVNAPDGGRIGLWADLQEFVVIRAFGIAYVDRFSGLFVKFEADGITSAYGRAMPDHGIPRHRAGRPLDIHHQTGTEMLAGADAHPLGGYILALRFRRAARPIVGLPAKRITAGDVGSPFLTEVYLHSQSS